MLAAICHYKNKVIYSSQSSVTRLFRIRVFQPSCLLLTFGPPVLVSWFIILLTVSSKMTSLLRNWSSFIQMNNKRATTTIRVVFDIVLSNEHWNWGYYSNDVYNDNRDFVVNKEISLSLRVYMWGWDITKPQNSEKKHQNMYDPPYILLTDKGWILRL